MSDKPGFSLLEVLIAIVLLAIVVAVCVPFLKVAQAEHDRVGRVSAFHLRVADAIASEHGSVSFLMNPEQYCSLASSNGWTCEHPDQVSLLTDEHESAGFWVVISDGDSSGVYWATSEEEQGP